MCLQTPTQFSFMQGIFIMRLDTGSGPPFVCLDSPRGQGCMYAYIVPEVKGVC